MIKFLTLMRVCIWKTNAKLAKWMKFWERLVKSFLPSKWIQVFWPRVFNPTISCLSGPINYYHFHDLPIRENQEVVDAVEAEEGEEEEAAVVAEADLVDDRLEADALVEEVVVDEVLEDDHREEEVVLEEEVVDGALEDGGALEDDSKAQTPRTKYFSFLPIFRLLLA